jgi:zinc protease
MEPPREPPSPAVDQGFRSTPPKPGPPREAPYPVAESVVLSNGLPVFLIRRPVGIVTISLIAHGGALDVPAGKSGLAAFTARLMTEGTQTRSSLELAKSVESLGATLSQDAGREYVALGLTTLEEDVDRGLELLADVTQHPAFAKSEIERVRGEWLDNLEEERQQPQRLSSLAGFRLLYGPRVGAPVSGSRADVRKLQKADLVRYHREHFSPKNLALLAAGDIELKELERLAERHFGKWKGATSRKNAL